MVSILGLVDKGLRQKKKMSEIATDTKVSILGLVDKGLRLETRKCKFTIGKCFNPWFSG